METTKSSDNSVLLTPVTLDPQPQKVCSKDTKQEMVKTKPNIYKMETSSLLKDRMHILNEMRSANTKLEETMNEKGKESIFSKIKLMD